VHDPVAVDVHFILAHHPDDGVAPAVGILIGRGPAASGVATVRKIPSTVTGRRSHLHVKAKIPTATVTRSKSSTGIVKTKLGEVTNTAHIRSGHLHVKTGRIGIPEPAPHDDM